MSRAVAALATAARQAAVIQAPATSAEMTTISLAGEEAFDGQLK
jgi:hypothetical protein